MKKLILTVIFIYIAIRALCSIIGLLSFFLSIGLSLFIFFIILIIWNIYPLCNITKHHVPILKNGIFYCKYCKQPLSKIK